MKIKILTIIVVIHLAGSAFIVAGVKNDCDQKSPLDNPFGFIKWEKTFDSEKFDRGICIQQTNDGGYIALAHGYAWDLWLIKLDSQGNKEWDKRYDRLELDYARYVQQTTDGGYIIVGESSGTGAPACAWLIKTDNQGNMTWERVISVKQETGGECIQQTRDGGYVIVGYTSPLNWLNCYDTWICKTDSQGYEEWNRTFERSWYNRAHSVKQTLDNGYIIVGGKASTLEGNSDLWLIKTDDYGNIQWDKTFGDESTWNMGRCIQLTSDGGYIIAGENLLIKTDADGNEEWSKPIGSMCVQQTTDGGYITTGYKEYWWKPTSKKIDLKLIKTDSQGNKEWTRIYGGEYRDAGNFVQQTTDGGYIVIGYREFPHNYPYQERDVWVIKTGKTPRLHDENTLPVSMPRNKVSTNTFILRLLEKFPHAFPLLRHLLGL